MLDCLIGAMSTGAFAFFTRRRLLARGLANEDLLTELRARGFDMEDHAMEAYLQKTYIKLDKLGEGVSGSVWKVQHKKNGEHFAMKMIKKKKGQVAEKGLETEIKCLRKLQHRHIVNIVDSVESSHHVWIVMECAEGGGLYERICHLRHFSERSAARVVKQVLKAVHYMHSYGVVHRDLKPENILLMSADENSDVKVADFGLAVILQHGLQANRIDESMRLKAATDITEGFCGSPICMAPEVASRNAAYGPQCDIWSVGCITFELLSGNPPFNAASAPELFQMIHTANGPSFEDWIWNEISADAKDLVVNMLQRRPEDRVSAREALQHRWFRTAPDNHNSEAQDNIIRRLTRETSFATTVTHFGPDSRPGSRRPSRAPSLVGADSIVPRCPTMLRPTLSIFSDSNLPSARTHGSPRATTEDDARSVKSDVTRAYGSVLNTDNLDGVRSEATSTWSLGAATSEAEGDANDPQDHAESKRFRITRGGLQRAAWGIGDDEYRLHDRLTHM